MTTTDPVLRKLEEIEKGWDSYPEISADDIHCMARLIRAQRVLIAAMISSEEIDPEELSAKKFLIWAQEQDAKDALSKLEAEEWK